MSDIVLGTLEDTKSFCHCLYPQGTDPYVWKKLANNYPKSVALVKLEDPSESG